MQPSRRTTLAVLLGGMLVVTAFVLASVLSTVVFAVTLAYVLYPLRQRLRARGASRRVSAAATTAAALAGVVGLAFPLGYVLYRRRRDLVAFLTTLPSEVVVDLGPTAYTIETEPLLLSAVAALRGLAVSVAAETPVLLLKGLVFVILVYGLLYKPQSPRVALLRLCPGEYHDVLLALHRRTAATLRAIYVLQAATAAGTFATALVTFAVLGYPSPFALAVIAGVLQFVPVLGPSVLIVALAGVDVIVGETTRALFVLVIGFVLVGFVPDAVIRPRLAGGATNLPVSVYFVGFVGGLLTLGAIGFVVGPLVVALLAETVLLLSDRGTTTQQRLPVGASGPLGPGDPAGLDGVRGGRRERRPPGRPPGGEPPAPDDPDGRGTAIDGGQPADETTGTGDAPTEDAPTDDRADDDSPAEDAPAEDGPIGDDPAEDAPTDDRADDADRSGRDPDPTR